MQRAYVRIQTHLHSRTPKYAKYSFRLENDSKKDFFIYKFLKSKDFGIKIFIVVEWIEERGFDKICTARSKRRMYELSGAAYA